MHTTNYEYLKKYEESAPCHQTLWIGSGHETRYNTEQVVNNSTQRVATLTNREVPHIFATGLVTPYTKEIGVTYLLLHNTTTINIYLANHAVANQNGSPLHDMGLSI